MPTMPTVFEREILDLSRAALRLEKAHVVFGFRFPVRCSISKF
jgi:hypothetical protein